ALLRPDITPQIARIHATRLADRPGPSRLYYEGVVMRRSRRRARRERQIHQAGIEHIGTPGPEADAEIIEVAAHACRQAGLSDFRIELGQVGLGRAALKALPADARAEASAAMLCKDGARLEISLKAAGLPAAARRSILGLLELYGGEEVLGLARRQLRGSEASAALDRLEAVVERVHDLLGAQLRIDLGELRHQAYYTGVSFTILAPGPGEPVGAGGRYDDLVGRFGAPAPATGMALDLDHLIKALTKAGDGLELEDAMRILVAGSDPESDRFAEQLREADRVAGRFFGSRRAEALAYARAWGYPLLVMPGARRWRALRVADETTLELGERPLEELLALSDGARGGRR
ncbi:MAG: ATP phosphoribosyltransferase regulatory subunit, partial [Myxococcales bacterium]|nr:ATP phosphoribosyltransferase regulatory subunit [Myxococcales bacterium]